LTNQGYIDTSTDALPDLPNPEEKRVVVLGGEKAGQL
jgi:hypothetical protein